MQALFWGFFSVLAGCTYIGTKILTHLVDMYFQEPPPQIIYYHNGQPSLIKTFETNEEMQAYIDTSQAHALQLQLFGHPPQDSTHKDSLPTN